MAIFIKMEDQAVRVKLNSFEKIPFLEIEKEKEILEKKFNTHMKSRVSLPLRGNLESKLSTKHIHFLRLVRS
jgi:hypothetical protein